MHVGSDWAKGPERKSTTGGSGETLVQNASDAYAEHRRKLSTTRSLRVQLRAWECDR